MLCWMGKALEKGRPCKRHDGQCLLAQFADWDSKALLRAMRYGGKAKAAY
jgi:hypothetical protein